MNKPIKKLLIVILSIYSIQLLPLDAWTDDIVIYKSAPISTEALSSFESSNKHAKEAADNTTSQEVRNAKLLAPIAADASAKIGATAYQTPIMLVPFYFIGYACGTFFGSCLDAMHNAIGWLFFRSVDTKPVSNDSGGKGTEEVSPSK